MPVFMNDQVIIILSSYCQMLSTINSFHFNCFQCHHYFHHQCIHDRSWFFVAVKCDHNKRFAVPVFDVWLNLTSLPVKLNLLFFSLYFCVFCLFKLKPAIMILCMRAHQWASASSVFMSFVFLSFEACRAIIILCTRAHHCTSASSSPEWRVEA